MATRCKICDSADITLKHEKIRDGSQIVDCNVWRCGNCEIVFLDMDIDQEKLLAYYKEGHFRNDYLPDIKDTESKRAMKFYSLKQPLQEKRFDILSDLFNKDMEVLDVGCATAGFLNILKHHVKRVKGIELYRPHVEFAREYLGLDVKMENIDDIKGEEFDVICLFHVLEHVPKPIEFMAQIYNNLKDKGLLIVEVPNIDDPLISIYDVTSYKNYYFMKPHLFYYSERSIGFLLRNAGFGDIEFRSYQHYGIINHLCWALTGETCTPTKVGGGGIEIPEKYLDRPDLRDIIPFFEVMNVKYKSMLEGIRKTDTLLAMVTKKK